MIYGLTAAPPVVDSDTCAADPDNPVGSHTNTRKE